MPIYFVSLSHLSLLTFQTVDQRSQGLSCRPCDHWAAFLLSLRPGVWLNKLVLQDQQNAQMCTVFVRLTKELYHTKKMTNFSLHVQPKNNIILSWHDCSHHDHQASQFYHVPKMPNVWLEPFVLQHRQQTSAFPLTVCVVRKNERI